MGQGLVVGVRWWRHPPPPPPKGEEVCTPFCRPTSTSISPRWRRKKTRLLNGLQSPGSVSPACASTRSRTSIPPPPLLAPGPGPVLHTGHPALCVFAPDQSSRGTRHQGTKEEGGAPDGAGGHGRAAGRGRGRAAGGECRGRQRRRPRPRPRLSPAPSPRPPPRVANSLSATSPRGGGGGPGAGFSGTGGGWMHQVAHLHTSTHLSAGSSRPGPAPAAPSGGAAMLGSWRSC